MSMWEPCLRVRLEQLCVARFAKTRPHDPLATLDVSWRTDRGLVCTAGGQEFGVVKKGNLELMNLLLQRCEPSVLRVPVPEPGISSLPATALARSVGSSARRSWRFQALLNKLERNETIRVVAVGASNTAMFAETCSGVGGRRVCKIPPNLPLAALDERLAARARALNKMPGADWLARFATVLHRRWPGAPKVVRAKPSRSMLHATLPIRPSAAFSSRRWLWYCCCKYCRCAQRA